MDPIINILGTGTSSVGKSSLCQELASIYPQGRYISSPVRNVARENNLPINEEGTDSGQYTFLDVVTKSLLISGGGLNFFDRGILDVVAYSNNMPLVTEKCKLKCLSAWEKYEDKYHAIIYLPPIIPNVSDGIRTEDLKFRGKIDLEIRKFLHVSKRPVLFVNAITMEDRLRKIEEFLTPYLV